MLVRGALGVLVNERYIQINSPPPQLRMLGNDFRRHVSANGNADKCEAYMDEDADNTQKSIRFVGERLSERAKKALKRWVFDVAQARGCFQLTVLRRS